VDQLNLVASNELCLHTSSFRCKKDLSIPCSCVVVAEDNLSLCQPYTAWSPRKSNKELSHTASSLSSLAHGGHIGSFVESLKVE
jgi:hypothetical protein